MLKYLLAGLVVALMLMGWIFVQLMAREFARRHPEFGPYVEKGGCGNCACSGSESCKKSERPS